MTTTSERVLEAATAAGIPHDELPIQPTRKLISQFDRDLINALYVIDASLVGKPFPFDENKLVFIHKTLIGETVRRELGRANMKKSRNLFMNMFFGENGNSLMEEIAMSPDAFHMLADICGRERDPILFQGWLLICRWKNYCKVVPPEKRPTDEELLEDTVKAFCTIRNVSMAELEVIMSYVDAVDEDSSAIPA